MESNTLKPGSKLKNGEYVIARILGQGGFGITYEAEQISLSRKVAIKEFFMKELCNRDDATSHVSVPSVGSKELVEKFRQKFIREAKMIAGFDNEHIVKIHDVFEENNTVYYVMEYLSGGSLADIVRNRGTLNEQVATKYTISIASALSYLHQKNVLHLDIKPSNILLTQKGQLKLIDFGISKHYDEAGSQTSSTPVGISKGYAPLEQYQQGGDVSKFTPATDIYALGATLYFLVTGTVPPDASEVNEEGLPQLPTRLSANIKKAIEKAMAPRKKDRPQSTDSFLVILGNHTSPNDDESTVIDLGDEDDEYRFISGSNDCGNGATDSVPTTIPLDTVGSWKVPTAGNLAGHEWVDLGLPSGLKWATTNVGASSPGEYGSYFAWGETTPKSSYDWDSYKWCNGSDTSLTRYNTKSKNGTTDYKEKLALSDDAAHQNWGSSWRMPTEQEFEELKANCTEEWTTMNGHAGRKFTSKKNGKSVFLPAAGWRYGSDLRDSGTCGDYWSSSLYADYPEGALYFYVYSDGSYTSIYLRCYGRSVRPVTE